MKTFALGVFSLGLFATAAVLSGNVQEAVAQERVFPYCLVDTSAQTHTCAFVSLQQCLASRNSTGDRCIPNPAWRW